MVYEIMFYGGILGAIIMCIVTISVFIKNDIWEAVVDLTGLETRLKKQKKAVEKPKKETEKIKSKGINEETDLINEMAEITGKLSFEKTDLLANEPTELIDECNTELISSEMEETSLLSEVKDETTILSETVDETLNNKKIDFIKELDIIVVNCEIAL